MYKSGVTLPLCIQVNLKPASLQLIESFVGFIKLLSGFASMLVCFHLSLCWC